MTYRVSYEGKIRDLAIEVERLLCEEERSETDPTISNVVSDLLELCDLDSGRPRKSGRLGRNDGVILSRKLATERHISLSGYVWWIDQTVDPIRFDFAQGGSMRARGRFDLYCAVDPQLSRSELERGLILGMFDHDEVDWRMRFSTRGPAS